MAGDIDNLQSSSMVVYKTRVPNVNSVDSWTPLSQERYGRVLWQLIDKLNDLWVTSIDICDASSDNMVFKMRATLLWTINNFLARSNLLGRVSKVTKHV